MFGVGCCCCPGVICVRIMYLGSDRRFLWGLRVEIPCKACELGDGRTRRCVVDIYAAFFCLTSKFYYE